MRQELSDLKQEVTERTKELEKSIEVTKTGLEKDIGFLKRLVWGLLGGLLSLVVGIVLRSVGLV